MTFDGFFFFLFLMTEMRNGRSFPFAAAGEKKKFFSNEILCE